MTGKNTLNTLYNDTLSIKILILKLPYLYRFRIKLYTSMCFAHGGAHHGVYPVVYTSMCKAHGGAHHGVYPVVYIFLELHSASIYLMMDDSTQKINSLMLFTRQNGMCQ